VTGRRGWGVAVADQDRPGVGEVERRGPGGDLWEGPATALDGNLPVGTFRVTVQQAKTGAELGRLRQTDQLGGVCTDVLTLKSVTAEKLVATSKGVEGNHDGCDPDPTTVYLTPKDGELVYTSDSSAEGNPTAVMTKAGD
ncbi:serine/threonine protein kinase, partial [Streptomyces sp. NPDC048279]